MDDRIESLFQKLNKDALSGGYFLNPDESFTKELIEGLIKNEDRYGYQACPCRLAKGDRAKDLDIICPCDYRDDDISKYGACYCGLYVSKDIFEGKKQLTSIPERRGKMEEKNKDEKECCDLKYPVYRCKVCGYLCARDEAPEICPICKVTKDRFERFM